jgi:hypothetical protein
VADSIAETLIKAAFATLVGTQASPGLYPTLSHDIGERHFGVHAKTTRVVAAPRGVPSELRQPDRPGDGNFSNAGRILLLRDFLIHWQVWDLSFGDTEALYLDVLRTLRNQNHHSITFSNETWDDQQEEQDGWDKLGTTISFDSFITMPVYERAPIRVALTATPQITTEVKLPADGSGETTTINQGTP